MCLPSPPLPVASQSRQPVEINLLRMCHCYCSKCMHPHRVLQLSARAYVNMYLGLGGGGEGVCWCELALLVGCNDQHPLLCLLNELCEQGHMILLAHHLAPFVSFLQGERGRSWCTQLAGGIICIHICYVAASRG